MAMVADETICTTYVVGGTGKDLHGSSLIAERACLMDPFAR